MSEEDLRESVRKRLAAITKRSNESADEIARGRRARWLLLGKVYEQGIEIDNKPALRSALNDVVEALPEMQDKGKWLASSHSVFEVLLVGALGYKDTLSKRHYYANACANAKAAEVPPNPEAFADWVQNQDGLIKASKSGGGEKKPDATKVIKDFKAKLSAGDEGDMIQFGIETEDSAAELGILLVEKVSDSEVRVVRRVTDPRVVASVIRQTDDTLTPAKLLALKSRALWDLNRTVLLKAKAWRGKLEAKDIEGFNSAVETLAEQPELFDLFFSGQPKIEIDPKNLYMKDQNEEAHVLDPARYIVNAKPLAMVPYDLKPDTPAKKAALKGIRSFVWWRSSPPRKRKPS